MSQLRAELSAVQNRCEALERMLMERQRGARNLGAVLALACKHAPPTKSPPITRDKLTRRLQSCRMRRRPQQSLSSCSSSSLRFSLRAKWMPHGRAN